MKSQMKAVLSSRFYVPILIKELRTYTQIMLTYFKACCAFFFFKVEFLDNAFLFLLPSTINVLHSVNFALSPKTSNGRQHVEAKLFGEESVIDLNIKGLIGP